MTMYVHGGYLWVAMCVVGSKDMVGHGNGAWGTQIALMGRHRGELCVQNTQQNNTAKQHSKTGDSGGCGVEQGPLKPNKNTQKKKKEGAEGANRNECEENTTDRPANIHTTTHQFCI